MSAVYRRKALRVCFTFRTVSNVAMFVIFENVPVDILGDEMANICNIRFIFTLLLIFIEGEKSRKGEVYN